MVPGPKAQANADEIVAAYRAWDAECKAVGRSVGFDGTDDVPDAFYEKIGPPEERIIETPAKTFGFRAKARAVAWWPAASKNRERHPQRTHPQSSPYFCSSR